MVLPELDPPPNNGNVCAGSETRYEVKVKINSSSRTSSCRANDKMLHLAVLITPPRSQEERGKVSALREPAATPANVTLPVALQFPALVCCSPHCQALSLVLVPPRAALGPLWDLIRDYNQSSYRPCLLGVNSILLATLKRLGVGLLPIDCPVRFDRGLASQLVRIDELHPRS